MPNVALYEDTPVNKIRAGGGFTLVCLEGLVRAPKLIIAANIFAEEMGFKKHRVVSIASFGTLTRQLTDDEMNLSAAAASSVSCRQAPTAVPSG